MLFSFQNSIKTLEQKRDYYDSHYQTSRFEDMVLVDSIDFEQENAVQLNEFHQKVDRAFEEKRRLALI